MKIVSAQADIDCRAPRGVRDPISGRRISKLVQSYRNG